MRFESKHNRQLRGRGAKIKGQSDLPDVPEGYVRCGVCLGCAKPLGSGGRLSKHRTPRGDECLNRLNAHRKPTGIKAPPVNLPDGNRAPKRNAWVPRPKAEPSRLDVGSNCRECGKWLPGERSLCGACYVKREASR